MPLSFPISNADGLPWIVGGVLILVGAALFVAGGRTFSSAATPLPTNRAARVLVTHGIYGWTRSPVYLGLLLLSDPGPRSGAHGALSPRQIGALDSSQAAPIALFGIPSTWGFVLAAAGQSLAFGSWPAFTIVLTGIVPTFICRARSEEKLLSSTFGEGYALYRQRTRMIIPYIL